MPSSTACSTAHLQATTTILLSAMPGMAPAEEAGSPGSLVRGIATVIEKVDQGSSSTPIGPQNANVP